MNELIKINEVLDSYMLLAGKTNEGNLLIQECFVSLLQKVKQQLENIGYECRINKYPHSSIGYMIIYTNRG